MYIHRENQLLHLQYMNGVLDFRTAVLVMTGGLTRPHF